MGEAFGEQCRESIQHLAAIRLEAAQRFSMERSGRQWSEEAVLEWAAASLPIAEAWDRETHDEFLGIAHGANLSPEALFIMQGLTDIRDHLAFHPKAEAEGCSSFILRRERAEGGRILAGQNWDLQTSNMEYVVLVRRRPDNGPETASLTLAGCLSLIGINSEGLAVGTTNFVLPDTKAGIHYLQLIHRLLRCRSAEEAATVAERAPRMAAHYYYFADASGEGIGLECSARVARRFIPEQGRLVRCNHPFDPDLQKSEPLPRGDSTCFRQQRLTALIDEYPGRIGVGDLKRFLSDHEGGELGICRHRFPPTDISTNACVIMSPEAGEIHACRGQAHAGAWERLALG